MLDCRWYIQTSSADVIKLTVNKFEVKDDRVNGSSCTCDYLEVIFHFFKVKLSEGYEYLLKYNFAGPRWLKPVFSLDRPFLQHNYTTHKIILRRLAVHTICF